MTDMKHVYINADFAKQIEAANGNKQLEEEVIKDIIQRKKSEFKYEVEMLEETLLSFKHFCVTHRTRLDEVYDSEIEKMDTLVDKSESIHAKVKESANNLAKQLQPLANEVNGIASKLEDLDRRLSSLNTYRLKDALDLVERISQLDDKSQKVLAGLLGG